MAFVRHLKDRAPRCGVYQCDAKATRTCAICAKRLCADCALGHARWHRARTAERGITMGARG